MPTPLLARLLPLAALALALGCSSTSSPPPGGFTLVDAEAASPDSQASGDALPDAASPTDDAEAGTDAVETPDVATAETYEGPTCSTDTVCKSLTATPWCNKQKKECVECLFDLHCPETGLCKNFQCASLTCTPGAKTCAGDFLETCNPDGKSVTQEACPGDGVCIGGACKTCDPGKTFCAKAAAGGQSKTLLQCNAEGSAAQVVATCTGDQVCVGAKCQVCIPFTKSCLGDKTMVCKADGSGYDVETNCSDNGWTCLGGLCVNPCDADIKSNTNVGCDYWAVDLDNALEIQSGKVYDAQNAQFAVIVSNTSTKAASVSVSLGDKTQPNFKIKTYTVAPQGLQVVPLPDPSWKVANQNQEGTSINAMVYRIQATQPIVAYQFNPLQNYGVFSNDASLLLPSHSLGKQYWVLSRSQLSDKYRSYVNVIATVPGKTTVKVVPSAKTLAGKDASGQPIAALKIGQAATFELMQGQALNLETDQPGGDLTGSFISADKPVAVFGGSEASTSPTYGNCVPKANGFGKICASSSLDGSAGTPCTKNEDCEPACCADHLEEQLFPVDALGQTYLATRLFARGKEQDGWRILAAENDTTVTLTPAIATVPKLQQGQHFELQTTQDFLIQSNKPVIVGQYMASSYATVTKEPAACTVESQCKLTHGFDGLCTPVGFGQNYCAPIGDPSLILGVSTLQYLDEYLFLVPAAYKSNYINVVAQAGTQVTLDDKPLADSAFTAVGATGWRVARMPIPAGAHRLKGTAGIGLVVYGYDDDVSYGYPGGAGLGGK